MNSHPLGILAICLILAAMAWSGTRTLHQYSAGKTAGCQCSPCQCEECHCHKE